MTRHVRTPLPPSFQTIGAATQEAFARAVTVRAMAYVLAASTADLADERECDTLLSVPETPGIDPAYSRAEVDDCLADALETARVLRRQAEVMHAHP